MPQCPNPPPHTIQTERSCAGTNSAESHVTSSNKNPLLLRFRILGRTLSRGNLTLRTRRLAERSMIAGLPGRSSQRFFYAKLFSDGSVNLGGRRHRYDAGARIGFSLEVRRSHVKTNWFSAHFATQITLGWNSRRKLLLAGNQLRSGSRGRARTESAAEALSVLLKEHQ